MSEDRSVFVDTNVFLYSLSGREPKKQPAAGDWIAFLWKSGVGRISWQVVHEFYDNAVRKFHLDPSLMRAITNRLIEWDPVAPSREVIERAWHWSDRAHLSFWDSLIVASAEKSGCQWLLTEDLQAGRQFGQVTVVSPFERTPEDLFG